MKITTDVNHAGLRSAGDALTRVPAGGSKTAEADRRFAAEFSAKIQRDRAMIDALAIAQTSRQLVQKAMDASSRLRAIAFEAMTSGSVNVEELSYEVSGIQGTLALYGESISVPVDRSSPAAADTGGVITGSFQKLSAYAGELLAGNRVNPDVFEGVDRELKPVAAALDGQISVYSSGISGTKARTAGVDYNSLNRITADMITGNPATGMAAQGRLNTEVTRMLSMA